MKFLLPLLFCLSAHALTVKDVLERDQRADVIVYLEASTDLHDAPWIEDRTARVRFVYDHLRETARVSQAPLLAELRAKGLAHRSFYIENAVLVPKASAETVRWLEARKEVRAVGLDARGELRLPPPEPRPREKASDDVPTHLRLIGADRAWNELGAKGKGIVIAGQDSGFYWEHNALRAQYRGNEAGGVNHTYSWHDGFGVSPVPVDDTGHGTHTMGTMVGFDGRANRIGVAPEAKWIGCRNMINGAGTVSSYFSCFEFFLAPYPFGGDPAKDGKPELAPHIVNNSWACPAKEGCTGEELLASVRAMQAAGIFVVVAAGNEGPSCRSVGDVPAKYAGELVSVGAFNRYTGDIAFFSSRGPSPWNGKSAPNLVAPGDIIRSAVPGSPDKYDDKGGTSMAAPHVAGVVALLWSARPELIGKIPETIDLLQRTAQPKGGADGCGGSGRPNNTFGYGMVDAYAAIRGARPAHSAFDYLVKLKPGIAQARAATLRLLGNYRSVRADVVQARLSEEQVKALRASKDVALVERNARLRMFAVPNDLTPSLWNLRNTRAGFDVNAVEAWDITTGSKDVIVAVIDGGIGLTHNDLAGNLWVNQKEATGVAGVDDDGNGYVDDINGYHFALNNGNPEDIRGHGSHVSGIIGAVGNNGRGIVGINWNVSIMALNMFPRYSEAQVADAIRAIDYAIANGARVINASWGQSDDEESDDYKLLREAVVRAEQAGVIFVAAAGNNGRSNDQYKLVPATFGVPNIIAVGSMDSAGRLGTSSNYGKRTVDIVAPGVSILSTVPYSGTDVKTGTSMAAPHVTGAVALLLAKNPKLTIAEVKRALIENCTPNPQLAQASACGGHLNLAAALRAIQN